METGNVVRELTMTRPVLGWRVWVVTETEEGPRLGSVIHEGVWAPGKTALAVCRRHEDVFAEVLPAHEVPSAACTCGFHAARDPADAFAYLRGRDERATICRIMGEVALWGRLVETERGWRASCAYPARLYVPEDDIAAALRTYDVPVESASAASARSMKSVRTPL
jgi:hypothetical protein